MPCRPTPAGARQMGSLGVPWGNAALKLGEVALVAAIAVVVVVMAVWFRDPGRWIDAFLLMAVTVTLALLALVMLS